MIVDLHTHFVDFDRELGENLLADMRHAGISEDTWHFTQEDYLRGTAAADRVVVFGIQAQRTGWNVSNERVAAFVERHAEKYVFFASVDPCRPDCMEQLKRYHREYGCRGIKLAPIYQGLHPLSEEYERIYTYCEENGLPILTHMAATFTSGVPLEYARPVHMDTVACRHPGLYLVLAHLGHPWMAETLTVIRRHRRVYADISALYYRPWQFYTALRLAVEYGCCQKLLFGSDFPATTTADSIQALLKINELPQKAGLPLIPEAEVQGILHRNPLDLFSVHEEGGETV